MVGVTPPQFPSTQAQGFWVFSLYEEDRAAGERA